MNRNLFRHLFCAFILAIPAAAQVPGTLNYQGRVAVGSVNFDGSGQFKFALVNATGSTTYWSNDGTSAAGSQPTAAVTLTVTKGLYAVQLGDATLANMTAVPASVFNNADVRLRVWFNDGTNGFQLLTPDQRIAAVGYAMMAGTVPDGSITQSKLAFAIGGGGGLPNGIQQFTTVGTQTFTVPAGVTRIQVEAWGGGGGAAGSQDVGATGGGGGYSRAFLTVTPGQVLTVYVGAGGSGAYAADTSSSAAASAGAASGVKNAGGSILIESGGGGGATMNGVGSRVGGSSGSVDANALIQREGYGGQSGNSTSGSIVPGGDVAVGTVAAPLGAHAFAGPGYSGNTSDKRRSLGTGGMYFGQFFGGGVAQNGFPGYVVISW